MTAIAIRTEALTRDFGAVRALDQLTLAVPKGTVFGFLGPNGAGKTTAIRALLGLLEPTAGRAEVLGLDTRSSGTAIRERCGALLEHPGLYERLSAEANLEFYGRVWHIPRAVRRPRIRALLDGFGLWDRRHEPVGRWSRGMKQKLAVARAVLHRPEVVFLDEPTSGLDPVASAALREDLAALASREGVTVFLTTHNLSEAERLCTQVGVIRNGRLLAVGSPDTLRAASGEVHVEITARDVPDDVLPLLRASDGVRDLTVANGLITVWFTDEPRVAPLVAQLVRHGAQIEEVRRMRPTLEDAFLEMMGSRDEGDRR